MSNPRADVYVKHLPWDHHSACRNYHILDDLFFATVSDTTFIQHIKPCRMQPCQQHSLSLAHVRRFPIILRSSNSEKGSNDMNSSNFRCNTNGELHHHSA
mmetsp:Transcript_6476/g.13527  ORF Transcript_6476/g.13527 Transcript_6476/m.13527 type:complete len:100 (+) Transcript_6476:89-388(+)